LPKNAPAISPAMTSVQAKPMGAKLLTKALNAGTL
jgi:hypothetical protein